MIRLIHHTEVDHVWPHISEGMEIGCRKAKSSMSAAELYRACRMGGWFLAVVTDGEGIAGAAVLDVQEHPLGRTMKIVALCGRDMDTWLPTLVRDWDWVETMGIERVVAEGRTGFARLLRRALPEVKVIREVLEWSRPNAG